MTPIYPSPVIYLGYDITEYRGIDEIMGTMEDFDELKNKLRENGLQSFKLYYNIIYKTVFYISLNLKESKIFLILYQTILVMNMNGLLNLYSA